MCTVCTMRGTRSSVGLVGVARDCSASLEFVGRLVAGSALDSNVGGIAGASTFVRDAMVQFEGKGVATVFASMTGSAEDGLLLAPGQVAGIRVGIEVWVRWGVGGSC